MPLGKWPRLPEGVKMMSGSVDDMEGGVLVVGWMKFEVLYHFILKRIKWFFND